MYVVARLNSCIQHDTRRPQIDARVTPQLHPGLFATFQRSKHFLPQFAFLAKRVFDIHVSQTRILTAGQRLELADEAVYRDRFAHRLSRAGLERRVRDVDVEVVVRWVVWLLSVYVSGALGSSTP